MRSPTQRELTPAGTTSSPPCWSRSRPPCPG